MNPNYINDNDLSNIIKSGLKFPISVEDFEKMTTEGNVFVDKTLLIKDIIESNEDHI